MNLEIRALYAQIYAGCQGENPDIAVFHLTAGKGQPL
jgi:hypothetical protein